MMPTISLSDASERLPEIISGLRPGEELLIVEGSQPLATLTRSSAGQWPCQAGSARHLPHWMAPDFDAPLEDFREYME